MYLFSWQTFIELLSSSQCDCLLLDVLCNGPGSLDNAKKLEATGDSEDLDPDRTENINSPNWCISNVCVNMGNEEENKCCRNRSCATSYVMCRKHGVYSHMIIPVLNSSMLDPCYG